MELGIEHVLTVPGSPATALVDELGRAGALIEDALNEKAAAELAFGRSLAGQATAVIVKGNGALLAAEPLQNAGPHGIGAPLLLIVGDDVTSASSTVPTDARPLGPLLVLPVFDLGPGELQRATIAAAIDASLSTRRPVVLRFTAAMAVDRDAPVTSAPATAPTDPEARTLATPEDPFHLSKFSRFVE
ncbi:MAG: thiamine pyrophosphate-binding protein, partial [Microthrixaceae bacterium]